MNFEPPAARSDSPGGNRSKITAINERLYTRRDNYYNNHKDNPSPLIRSNSPPKSQRFNGGRRFHHGGRFNRAWSGNRGNFSNPYNNNQDTGLSNYETRQHFSRKRQNDQNYGPFSKSPKFSNQHSHPQSNSSLNTAVSHPSAQERLTKIRNTKNHEDDDVNGDFCITTSADSKPVNHEESLDATDITVQLVNANCKEPEIADKFKMVLDPHIQASIKVIQAKQKDKQVIFPFPVKPNSTAISTHERFSYL